jgi:hypothetical protein
MTFATQRDIFLWTLQQFVGTWYSWGGDDPEGFDCSGLVIEGLRACGKVPRQFDTTADGLWHHFPRVQRPRHGCLVFWGTTKATHVEVVLTVIDGIVYTIGASGGGSATKTKEDAIRANAFVKVRPAKQGWMGFVDPF